MTAGRLRGMSVLDSLSDDEVAHLAATGRELSLAAGEVLFRQGDRASVFHVVLEGRLETTRDVGGEQVLMLAHGPGGYLGAMALLTDTPYRGSTTAVDDSRVFAIDGAELRRLAFTHPALLREVLPAVEAVSATIKGIERDREKLYAVGKLAAGLAHELNNPAAAAARGVSHPAGPRGRAPGGLRRDRRGRRPGGAAGGAGLARRRGGRADGSGRAARPDRRERPRAGAGEDARGAWGAGGL